MGIDLPKDDAAKLWDKFDACSKMIVGQAFNVEQVSRVKPMRFDIKGIYTPFSIPVPLRNLVLPRINFYDCVVTTVLF